MTFVSIAPWITRQTMKPPERTKVTTPAGTPMDVIRKNPHDYRVLPNLTDYEHARTQFHWSDVPALCEGMGPGKCNIAYAALDRHMVGPTATRTALRFVIDNVWDGAITTRDLSYAELGRHAKRFSNALRSLGINRGDRVFTVMSRSPELYIAMLGALRNGSIVSPLFSAFGPEPIATRVEIGQADVLVTTRAIYQRKIAKIRERLTSVRHIFVVDDDNAGDPPPGTLYGIISPLLHGVTSIVDEAEFDAERWYRILQDQGVSVWYTAPTAIRMLIKAGPELPAHYQFSRLRFIASVGEPLNPEAVWWGKRVLGLPIHDNWWQTETGGIMIANTPAFDIKPGSMGRPLPGVDAFLVRRIDDGTTAVIVEPDVEGELALKPGWPSMFRGYLHAEVRYRNCFSDGLYLTGDLAKKDADGYFWFVGRKDDV